MQGIPTNQQNQKPSRKTETRTVHRIEIKGFLSI